MASLSNHLPIYRRPLPYESPYRRILSIAGCDSTFEASIHKCQWQCNDDRGEDVMIGTANQSQVPGPLDASRQDAPQLNV